MKSINLLLMIPLILTALSFTTVEPPPFQTGTYGVCLHDDSAPHTPVIELHIHADHTFNYINHTDPDNKMDVQGTWTQEDNTIRLHDYPVTQSLSDKWRIDKTGHCLKTRKEFLIMRLCHWGEC